ncbi:unnamed protein product [Allacma fusca]|uniref:PAXIP1-associated glutamate-rich protein 1 n=1 Tax=Allacma fusca TaxID=39272 RepID=A0A8J2KTM2_9HEXA|nr:unnamed protein product [Allacma fusca]
MAEETVAMDVITGDIPLGDNPILEGQHEPESGGSMNEDIAKMSIEDQNSYSWAPEPEEVLQLFDELKKIKYFSFNWECPGRRNPYEEEQEVPEPEKITDASKEAEVEADDFDFEEESTPVPRRPSKVSLSLLKGSAKKRTTSLAGILSNMERHRIMDKMQSGDSASNPP